MVYAGLCFWLNWRLTLLTLAIAPLNAGVQYLYVKIMRPAETALQEKHIARRNFLVRIFGAFHLVKLFTMDTFVVRR